MTARSMRRPATLLLATLLLGAFVGASAAQGDPGHRRGHGHYKQRGHGHHKHRGHGHYEHRSHRRYEDRRHGHHRHYPRRGHRVRHLPRYSFEIAFGGHHHYYHSGVWYRRHRRGYVVGVAPVGAVIRVLPPYHTTVWVHDVPYYYANLTYYLWDPLRTGYVVVQDPPEAEVVPADGEPYVYPSRGQSPAQQDDDRYACHRWGVEQTGFDPSRPLMPGDYEGAGQLRAEYQRAVAACLEGRGYTVR